MAQTRREKRPAKPARRHPARTEVRDLAAATVLLDARRNRPLASCRAARCCAAGLLAVQPPGH